MIGDGTANAVEVAKMHRPFGLFHWDTFDPPGADLSFIGDTDTIDEAIELAKEMYKDKLDNGGADRLLLYGPDKKLRISWTVG